MGETALKKDLGRNPARIKKYKPQEAIAGYLFTLPAIAGFLIFVLGPMLYCLYLSFTRYAIVDAATGTPPAWVGLGNYIEMFTNPISLFPKSLGSTFYYAFGSMILSILFSLWVAVLLNRKFLGRNSLRAAFFMPSVMPIVATSVVWTLLLQPQFGLLNYLLRLLHLPQRNFLGDEALVIPALVIMSLWFCGGTIVVFLASLQDVPVELREAVAIDGGNKWHEFIHVTLPCISPVIFFQFIIGLVGAVQIFTQVVVMTNGGPNNVTRFLNFLIFVDAFRHFRMGYASAEAFTAFVIVLILTALIFKSSNFWVHYQGGDK